MRTFAPKREDIKREWHVIDAEGLVLGRLATEVAKLLRGKEKPIFAPNTDVGDFVVIINAEKVVMTSNKMDRTFSYSHSGYPGGLRKVSFKRMLSEKPEELLTKSIKGMLPKNRLGRKMIGKLKVYAGPAHPHAAQLPKEYIVEGAKRAS